MHLHCTICLRKVQMALVSVCVDVYSHYGDLTAVIGKGFSLSSKVSRWLRTAGPFPRSWLQLLRQRWS